MDKPRTVLVLAAGYGLTLTSIALVISAAPLIGASLAPSRGLATLPVTLQILGTMSASLPASLLMGKLGRRAGFLLGTGIGAAGAAVATWGIISGSFWLFCAGSLGIGMLNGFGQFYRFAAADVAGADKAKAISWVMAGGLVAGVVGPALAANTESLAAARFAASYASMLVLYLIIVALLLRVEIPRPVSPPNEGARPLGAIFAQPMILLAVLGGAFSYAMMMLVMTATPLSVVDAGHDFKASARIIQLHIVAMFLPSFWTGKLIARFGTLTIMGAGGAALVAQPIVAIQGLGIGHFSAALILLGVGWNFLFIGATNLLTSHHRVSETAKVQGVNDLMVFGAGATMSFMAGRWQNEFGWIDMNHFLIPGAGAILLILILGSWFYSRPKPAIKPAPE